MAESYIQEHILEGGALYTSDGEPIGLRVFNFAGSNTQQIKQQAAVVLGGKIYFGEFGVMPDGSATCSCWKAKLAAVPIGPAGLWDVAEKAWVELKRTRAFAWQAICEAVEAGGTLETINDDPGIQTLLGDVRTRALEFDAAVRAYKEESASARASARRGNLGG